MKIFSDKERKEGAKNEIYQIITILGSVVDVRRFLYISCLKLNSGNILLETDDKSINLN